MRHQQNTAKLTPAPVYPFSAIVGQEELKLGLILNVIDPNIGGVLLMGHRGTGKSTAVRALADLLPTRKVVATCRFNCDPHDPTRLCSDCKELLGRQQVLRSKLTQVPVVDLPLGSTEDRICGSIDIQRALADGVKAFEPGLLARANRGFLYIDEVNLLEDHLVDLLLDVAVTGRNQIERENISFEHPAQFVLVGSGNPEEGELRPQLLDRFGLYVEVKTENHPEARIEIAARRDAFDRDPNCFVTSSSRQQAKLQRRITRARKLVARMEVERELLLKIATICSELNVQGHRGELTVMRAARAFAALDGRTKVRETDVRRVALMALRHRLDRELGAADGHDTRIEQSLEKNLSESGADQKLPIEANGHSRTGTTNSATQSNIADAINARLPRPGLSEQPPSKPRPSPARSKAGAKDYNFESGRYVKSRLRAKHGSRVAVDATLRAFLAAGAGKIQNQQAMLTDSLRFKEFARKRGTLFVVAVDTSGSMATVRIRKAKGAILNLLQESYVKRDSVAIIGFRGNTASVLLPPSRSIVRARRVLDSLVVGGSTPLPAGLKCSLDIASKEVARFGGRTTLLLFTDGGGNVPLRGAAPDNSRARRNLIHSEVEQLGKALRKALVDIFVVQTNTDYTGQPDQAESLAQLMGAKHVVLQSPTDFPFFGR